MILDSIGNHRRYHALHPLFPRAFAFLEGERLADLPAGRIDLDGDRLFAIVSEGPGRRREEGRLEIHRGYVDIQYVVSGTDGMGWKPARECTEPSAAFDAEKDVGFFEDGPVAWFPVGPGAFAVFFPEDAHLPLVSDGVVRKVVVKVAVADDAGRVILPLSPR